MDHASPTINPFLRQIYAEGIIDDDGNITDILKFIKLYIIQINALREEGEWEGTHSLDPAADFIREMNFLINDEGQDILFTDSNGVDHTILFSNLHEQLYEGDTSEANVFQMIHVFKVFMDHLGGDNDNLITIYGQVILHIRHISNALRADEVIGPMIQHIKDSMRNNKPDGLPENGFNDANLASTVGGKRKTRKRNIRKTKKKGKGKRRRTHRRS